LTASQRRHLSTRTLAVNPLRSDVAFLHEHKGGTLADEHRAAIAQADAVLDLWQRDDGRATGDRAASHDHPGTPGKNLPPAQE